MTEYLDFGAGPISTKAELFLLKQRRQSFIDTEGGPLFLGIPDRWLDNVTFRCIHGHVSKCILKSEEQGDLCLACYGPVLITFPEDEEQI